MVGVERSDHFVSSNDLHNRRCNRGGGSNANILISKADFTKKFTWPQNGDDGFLFRLGGHGELHAAFLNVHERLGNIALRENSSTRCEAFIQCGHSAKIECNFG